MPFRVDRLKSNPLTPWRCVGSFEEAAFGIAHTSFDECATAAHGKQCLQASLELVRQPLQTRLETKDCRKGIRMLRKLREIDYCGEMWYYTKLNEDNASSQATGGSPEPDARGQWRLRENGWGHGFAWGVTRRQQTRQYGWHHEPTNTLSMDCGRV